MVEYQLLVVSVDVVLKAIRNTADFMLMVKLREEG